MEILLVGAIDPFESKPGGTKTYISNIINSLKSTDIHIILAGISYGVIPNDNRFQFIPMCQGKNISSIDFFLKLLFKAKNLPVKRKSIIHLQRPEDVIPFMLFFSGNPRVLTIHGIHSKQETLVKHGVIIGSVIQKIFEVGLKHVDHIIAVNEETRRYLVKEFKLENKISLIPPGVDLKIFKPLEKHVLKEKFGFQRSDKIILYVGRFDKVKGLDFLIRSFKILTSRLPDVKLVLVGDGMEKHDLQEISHSSNNIIFINTMINSRIPEIMNCADVFALSSHREGMPTVVLEALACGLPVVSTDAGDVSKVVKDDITGYLIKRRDEQDFANCLIKVLTKNSDFFFDNCIIAAKDYSSEKMAQKLVSIYNEIHKKK